MIRATNAHYGAGRGVMPNSYVIFYLGFVFGRSKLVISGYASIEKSNFVNF